MRLRAPARASTFFREIPTEVCSPAMVIRKIPNDPRSPAGAVRKIPNEARSSADAVRKIPERARRCAHGVRKTPNAARRPADGIRKSGTELAAPQMPFGKSRGRFWVQYHNSLSRGMARPNSAERVLQSMSEILELNRVSLPGSTRSRGFSFSTRLVCFFHRFLHLGDQLGRRKGSEL